MIGGGPGSLADRLFQYEDGELGTTEVLELFAELVKTGMAWQLQGSYGRTAANMIENGLISPEGEVLA